MKAGWLILWCVTLIVAAGLFLGASGNASLVIGLALILGILGVLARART